MAREHDADILGASDRAERLLGALGESENEAPLEAPRLPLFERASEAMGEKVFEGGRGVTSVVGFLGAAVAVDGRIDPPSAPFPLARALVRQPRTGGRLGLALPIIGLMSFLIGVVIAQQGACSCNISAPKR